MHRTNEANVNTAISNTQANSAASTTLINMDNDDGSSQFDDQGVYVGPSRPYTASEMMEEITSLCHEVAYMRSWFMAHEKLLESIPGSNTSRVHEHFVIGAGRARMIASEAGLDVDFEKIAAFDWNARPWHYVPDVGPPPPYTYAGGDLGFTNNAPSIIFHKSDGVLRETNIQAALRAVDLFAEPGRTQLLAGAAVHYGLAIDALMGGKV